MNVRIDDSSVLRAPATVIEHAADAFVAIDAAAPNWIATDERGVRILRYLDGRTPLKDIVSAYAADAGLDVGRAWLHVDTFVRDALRQQFISTDGAVPLPTGALGVLIFGAAYIGATVAFLPGSRHGRFSGRPSSVR